MAPAISSSRSVSAPISAAAAAPGRSACGRAYRTLGGPVAMGALSRSLPAFLVAEVGRTGQVPDPQRDRALGHAEGGGDLLEVQALCAQSAGALAQVVLGSGPAGPLRRRLALESVVERGVAHRAEDLLDLPPGFTLAAELDSTFPQGGHFLNSAHIRILVRVPGIRSLDHARVRELHENSGFIAPGRHGNPVSWCCRRRVPGQGADAPLAGPLARACAIVS